MEGWEEIHCKGLGDALHEVMCGEDHNIQLLIRKLRLFCNCLRLNFKTIWSMAAGLVIQNSRASCYDVFFQRVLLSSRGGRAGQRK